MQMAGRQEARGAVRPGVSSMFFPVTLFTLSCSGSLRKSADAKQEHLQ